MIARRNIGILAHIDAGKTTVTEHLLHVGGAVSRPGSVDAGTTVTDWMVDEQERGITITSAASSFRWRDVEITVVDTPGHVDFTIEVERSLRVIDGVVLVISGPDRVQAQTETVWLQAVRHALPAVGFINKLDREGFSLEGLLAAIAERLAIQPVILQIPIIEDARLTLIDVISGDRRVFDLEDGEELGVEPPDETEIILRLEALEDLIDAIASHDDAFAEAVLEGREPTRDAHLRALGAAVRARAVLPLVFGSARLGIGLEALADAIVALLPSPDERALPAFSAAGTLVTALPAHATSAYVFKTEPRRHGTRLAFLRVVTGRLVAGAELCKVPGGERLAPARPVVVIGQDFEPVDTLDAGAIGAIAIAEGEVVPLTGETIGSEVLPYTFERLRLPEPVMQLTVEAPDPSAHDRMVAELERQCADDPSLRLGVERETGRILLSGMGELHLEVALKRAERALGITLRAGRPEVRERRVLASEGRAEVTVHHPTGRARVRVAVTIAPSEGLAIEVPPLLRAEWRDAVRSGLEAAVGADGQGGRPLIGGAIAAEVEAHGADVVPIMFRDAAEWATLKAIEASGVSVAEPWCALTVIAPDASIGRVVGDLARRRGRVRRTEARGVMHELVVDAPLSELVGYASDLRSLTAGRGQFSIEPVGYRVAERKELES